MEEFHQRIIFPGGCVKLWLQFTGSGLSSDWERNMAELHQGAVSSGGSMPFQFRPLGCRVQLRLKVVDEAILPKCHFPRRECRA